MEIIDMSIKSNFRVWAVDSEGASSAKGFDSEEEALEYATMAVTEYDIDLARVYARKGNALLHEIRPEVEAEDDKGPDFSAVFKKRTA
jgi:hypothetical protein